MDEAYYTIVQTDAVSQKETMNSIFVCGVDKLVAKGKVRQIQVEHTLPRLNLQFKIRNAKFATIHFISPHTVPVPLPVTVTLLYCELIHTPIGGTGSPLTHFSTSKSGM
jgi:hypothetical protein